MPYTLKDLQTWSPAAHGPSFAVLGHPIKHSKSPAMHNAAIEVMAKEDERFAGWRYDAFDIAPEQLPEALPLFLEKGFLGLNLTAPHKVIAFPLIAEVDPHAQPIGAVNTLIATPKGWRGTNTDGYGLATGIREDLGLELADHPVVILGAGGAARGAAVQCLQAGCASLTLVNRSAPSLDALVADLAPLLGGADRAAALRPSAECADQAVQAQSGDRSLTPTATGGEGAGESAPRASGSAKDRGGNFASRAAGPPVAAAALEDTGLFFVTLRGGSGGGSGGPAFAEGRALPLAGLYINATSAGLRADDALPFDLERAPRPVAAYDMIYNPPETRWLAQARQRGLRCANGLSMLVHQGAAALSLWAGRPVPTDVMARAALGRLED